MYAFYLNQDLYKITRVVINLCCHPRRQNNFRRHMALLSYVINRLQSNKPYAKVKNSRFSDAFGRYGELFFFESYRNQNNNLIDQNCRQQTINH